MKVICDLDGTLFNINHRVHFIEQENPDWTSFYANAIYDTPIMPTVEVIVSLYLAGHDIVFVTGRSEEIELETIAMLRQSLRIKGAGHRRDRHIAFTLFMREKGDHRPDYTIKKEWYNSRPQEFKASILFVLEDRQSVVDMWRNDCGVVCHQVAKGDF
jgi:hypothetical protein